MGEMKLLLKIIGALVVLGVALLLGGFLLPSAFRVERSVVIKAPPEAVFAPIADLKRWKEWGVWQQRDPLMELSYSASSTGVGATSSWRSKSQGNGGAKITQVDASKKFVFELSFEGFDRPSLGTYLLEPAEGGTRVRWIMEGDVGANPISRWFAFFMDRLVGSDFEAGLANLKKNVEKS